MKLIVGLGNPGKKYEGTRHNIGFDLLAEFSRRPSATKSKKKFDSEIAEASVGGERVLLVAPQTFMNLSGRSVRQVVDFFHIPVDSLIVVCDDINLPLGRIRLRGSGSSGGQKGLESVIQHLGTKEFPRLRIGVDLPPGNMDAADFVLSRFGKRESVLVEAAVTSAVQALETWVAEGLSVAMNRFNAAGSEDGS